MRIVAAVLLAASPALLAQRQVSPSGYGRILFPGGQPTPAGTVSNGGGRIVFPGTGAPFVSRQGPIGSVWTTAPLNPPRQDHEHDRRRGVVAVPVPVPVYYNTGYYDYDPPPAQVVYPVPATPVAGYTAPEYRQQEPPVVIINQYFRGDEPPVTQTQPQATAPAELQPEQTATPTPAREETVFLIAMKDHNVYTARAYWIENGVLNYISTDGVESSVNLDDVDRDLSRRLNRDRNVAFGLPAN